MPNRGTDGHRKDALTAVYQIDAHAKRLLWVGRDRSVQTLSRFFQMLGKERSAELRLVCSDLWRPYLRVMARRVGQALHVLDRFHVVLSLHKAVDQVRAQEARELRQQAIAKNILVDENGLARGVAYIDRNSKQEFEVYGKAVVVAASCIASARIMLNSKSRHWPTGIANSSGELGRNLCDHLYGDIGHGYLPQLLGQPSFPDNVSDSTIAWMPRWQNLKNPREEKFIRGYSVYPGGGCGGFPYFYHHIEGFGSQFKRDVKRYYPTPVSATIQAPSLRSDSNYVDIDPEAKDIYGIPCVRIHFQWDPNTLMMWEHAKEVWREVIKAAGGEYMGAADHPEMPGYSLHETGCCRMGNDPKKSVTNRFGQTHDVPNLLVCDASVFLNCTDKTTTLSILTFTLRTCEYLVERFRRGEIAARV